MNVILAFLDKNKPRLVDMPLKSINQLGKMIIIVVWRLRQTFGETDLLS